MTSMKYTGKPVIKQLFSILDTLFSLGNYIHALNSKSVASFPFGIGDSLVLGYTPSLVTASRDLLHLSPFLLVTASSQK